MPCRAISKERGAASGSWIARKQKKCRRPSCVNARLLVAPQLELLPDTRARKTWQTMKATQDSYKDHTACQQLAETAWLCLLSGPR